MKEQILLMFTVIGGAAAVPFVARRFRIPSAVLEITYGIIIFNFFITGQPEWFSLLKELGLIYLMFIAGMELDLRSLMKGKRFWWYILISMLSLGITPLMLFQMGYPLYLGIAVSVVSAGIIIPILKESDIFHTDTGRDIIGIALTGELLSILILMGINIHHQHGFTFSAFLEAAKLVMLTMLAGLFLKILYIIAWWNPDRVEKVMESEDPVEEGIRAVISIAFAGGLIAYGVGVEPILGSFFAGVVFGYVFRSKGRFEDKINAVGFGFLTPFFFIGVGADFDVALLQSAKVVFFSLLLVVMVFVSNIYPVLFSRLMKIRGLDALSMSFILSAPLSMIVVAGSLGMKMNLIGQDLNGVLILTAISSSILYPILFRAVSQKISPPSAANRI